MSERDEVAEPGGRSGPEAGQLPVKWSWEERARRAEALAERLAACLGTASGRIARGRWDEDMKPVLRDYDAALDAWASHCADLATLEQAQEAAR